VTPDDGCDEEDLLAVEPGRPYATDQFQYSVVIPELLWLGEAPREADLDVLSGHGIEDVINLTPVPHVRAAQHARGLRVHHFPFPDGGFGRDPACAPARARAQEMMVAAARTLEELVAAGRRTYLHCMAGISRSPSVLILWLLQSGRARTFPEALDATRTARPLAWPNTDLISIVRELVPRAFPE
jgi:protein-tyrosine phosphatase